MTGLPTNDATRVLEPFVEQWGVSLTTYTRDGTPVGTAVNIVVEGDRAYFRTWDTAWKLGRIHTKPEVEFAPCTPLGRPTGPPTGWTPKTRSPSTFAAGSARTAVG